MRGKIVLAAGFFLAALVMVDMGTSRMAFARSEYGVGSQLSQARMQLEPSGLSSMPLAFTENRGQFCERTEFRCNATGAAFSFGANEVVYLLSPRTDELMTEEKRFPKEMTDEAARFRLKTEGLLVRVRFPGANPDAELVGEEMLPHKNNYFRGSDRSLWHTDVPNYSGVRYKNIYPGIDLKYHSGRSSLKYDFIVGPGADPSVIQVQYHGVNSLWINDAGELVIGTRFGELVESAPHIYQEIGETKCGVSGGYRMISCDCFGFYIGGQYDRTQPLVIDPDLIYSTYLGRSGLEEGDAIAVDGSGHVYVTGKTSSWDFPMENPYQTDQGGWDVFITKLSPSGDSLIYSTYLGGGDYDWAEGIAVDDSGYAYVVGGTESTDFPTENPYQDSLIGSPDAFTAKLSPSGDSLVYSTYLGGDDDDVGFGIAVDDSGNAYVSGYTDSDDFPTENPYQDSLAGLQRNAFITKLSPSGDSLVYSTYLGGTRHQGGYDITADDFGHAYVVGSTSSDDFPTENAYQDSLAGLAGLYDAFITKFSPSGDSLVYSTYLGGGGNESGESGYGIAIDVSGNAYVMGLTQSSDFPTENPYQTDQGGWDAFITKLSPSGDSLAYSTYLGGDGPEYGGAIVVDDSGHAYVVGHTSSSNFPTENPYQDSLAGLSDLFITMLSPSGDSLVYSTYLGGDGSDLVGDIAIDDSGNAYVTGRTQSTDFPTKNPYQDSLIGNEDVFIAKLSSGIVPYACGDCNADGFVNFADALYVKNYYYQTPPGSPAPIGEADVNLDGYVNFADALYIKNYYYQTPQGSPPPCEPTLTAPSFRERRMER